MTILTVTTATTVVRRLLDAETDTARWTDAQVRQGLHVALDRCVEEYCMAGGDRLEEVVSATSTTSGTVDLNTYNPIVIKGVSVLQGNRRWPITGVRLEEQNFPDETERSLEIRLVKRRDLSATLSDPLVSGNTWPTLEHWICLEAASWLSVIDDEVRDSVMSESMKARDIVMKHIKTPTALDFPKKAYWLTSLIGYAYNQATHTLILTRRT